MYLYNASLEKKQNICVEIVLISSKSAVYLNYFRTFAPNIQLKYVFIMARPIRETPVLTGFDCGDKERSTHLL